MPEQGVITGMRVQWRVTMMDDGWFDGETDGETDGDGWREWESTLVGVGGIWPRTLEHWTLDTGHWTLRPHGSQSLN